ncbi:uncharacterized protein LOC143025950 [Oratosquilla oratoria]|uniref:uncharacterized protein LOC143025950 n=1 Tax=Oratosquilla oratoria TaxID=337810 RepID=UPI003F769E5A
MVRAASLVLLLLPALVLGEGDAQNYNYAPPVQNGYLPPVNEPPCPPVTSQVYTTVYQNVPSTYVVHNVNTKYVTTTHIRTQVVPTTVYSTRIHTQVNYQTSVVQVTNTKYAEHVVTNNVPSPPVYKTTYVTTTRVVPQVQYVTRTNVQTQVVPVEVTNTQYKTEYSPVVKYQTKYVQQTQVITLPAQTVRQTQVQTVVQTSIQRQPSPPQTRVQYTTVYKQSVQTQRVPSPPVYSTKVEQSQQVIPTVVVNTRYQNSYVTKQNVVTRTSHVTQTRYTTQYVPQEVVTTQYTTNVAYTTHYTTRLQPYTQIQTVLQTNYNTPPPVYSTHQAYYTSVVQVPGPNRVVTKYVNQTQQRQKVVYQTKDQYVPVTRTKTVTEPCSKSGYNYDAPSTPFHF